MCAHLAANFQKGAQIDRGTFNLESSRRGRAIPSGTSSKENAGYNRIASEIYYWPKRRHLSLLCPVEGQQRGSRGQAMQPTL